MHVSDRGSHERARRARQSKANGSALVEEVQMLKDVLVADAENITVEIILAKLDPIEGLAVYIEDPPKAERKSLGIIAQTRGTSVSENNDEGAMHDPITPDEETDASPYNDYGSPSSVNRRLRDT